MKMQNSNFGIVHIKIEKSCSLSRLAEQTLHLSSARFDELLQLGCIYNNNKRLNSFYRGHNKGDNSGDASQKNDLILQPNDILRVHQNPRRFCTDLLKYPECLIYECSDFLIVNKPSGLPVHPTVDNTQENLVKLLSDLRQEHLHITHRLDIATSGLIFLARTKQAQKEFNKLLTQRQIKKIYCAQISGEYLGEKTLTHYMEPSPKAPKKVTREKHTDWFECSLNILEQKFHTKSNETSLKIELITGRTHQIRAQLAAEGHPIVGDSLYGDTHRLAEKFETIGLQSTFLSFNWYGTELKFEIAKLLP